MKRTSLTLSLVALLVGSLSASAVRPATVEKLTRESRQVVQARAVSSVSKWNAERTRIYTYTTFEVSRRFKGAAVQRIVVKQLGGSADGYAQRVSGVRQWKAGDESVLFLRSSKSGDGTYVVTGLMQGDFRIRRDAAGNAIASNGIAGVESVMADGRTVGFRGVRIPLEQLAARIQKAVAE